MGCGGIDVKFTDAAARNAKAGEKPRKLAVEGGLYLLIQPSGSKLWRYKYRFEGKEKVLALGVYPDVSLAAAARRHRDARSMLAEGADPGAAKAQEKAARRTAATTGFEAVAREWFAKFSPGWAKSHSEKVIRRLELDVFPWIGAHPIAEIDAAKVLSVVQRIESRGTLDTAHRAKQNCGQVFRYAVATGRAKYDPTSALRGAIPRPEKRHFAAITDLKQVGELMRAIDSYHGDHVTRQALRLAPLVFVRPGELRQAEWSGINLDAGEWRYFVSKTKTQHIVPLSTQAVAVLRELHPLTGAGRYVFPGALSKARPMSENTVLGALRRLGYPIGTMTGHGFRAMARTLLAEIGWKPDAIERQLAHKVRGPLGAAYDRAQFLVERRAMMQAWADYLDALRDDRNVIAGKFGKAA